jgi:hypothetical protein
MTGDSVGTGSSGGGNDLMRGGDGNRTMIGDSNAFTQSPEDDQREPRLAIEEAL